MSEPTPIAQVEDRLTDLIDALREAGRADLARILERHAQDFTAVALVRRAVEAIRRQLEAWRQEGSDLPDTPKVQLAANRLEDVCREALQSGVIAPARPSIGTHARRKLGVALVTLLGATLVLLIGIALIEAGVDLDQLGKPPPAQHTEVVRGAAIEVTISALQEALVPESTTGLTVETLPECRSVTAPEQECGETEEKAWPEGRLKTWEIKQPNQVYGLLFSIAQTRLIAGKVAEARVLIAATNDTPEGTYEIPLRAAYEGYTPQRCEPLQRLSRMCPSPRTGPGERHKEVPLPLLVVKVLPSDPSQTEDAARIAAQQAEETRRKAEERAAEIESALSAIQREVKETEQLARRKQWEPVRERLNKLGALFAPLDAASLAGEAPGALPAAVGKVRARYETLHEQLEKLEMQIFEAMYAEVTAETNENVSEDKVLAKVGKRFRVSPDYVQQIYTDRAEEIQRRVEERARLHLEKVRAEQQALERRCGSLPTSSWKAADSYIHETFGGPRIEVSLGECMTPRLTPNACWEMACDFTRKEEVAVERPKVVTKHHITLYLVHGKIVQHGG